MDPLTQVVLLTALAGAAIPVGGLLASIERIQSKWLQQEFRHAVIAFGGGVLLSAVSLVLVPHGVAVVSLPLVIVSMLSGGIAFLLLDVALSRLKGSAAQLAAMLSDFVPEAIALGAAFAHGQPVGLVLALLIALQNLPEGFNAYRELAASSKLGSRTILIAFLALVPIGPVSGLMGYWWLAPFPTAVGALMLFAAGGILYLTFQDIAPQAQLKRRWAPNLGAVIGFLFGLVGQLMLAA